MARVARGVIRKMAEWKHFYPATVSGPTASTGGIHLLSDVTQGDTDKDRDGDQLYCGRLSFFAFWNLNAGTSVQSNIVRGIVFQWFPASTPGVQDILEIATGQPPMHPYVTDKAFQYKILWDKCFSLNKLASTSQDVNSRVYRRKVKIPRKKIQFIGGTTSAQNHLYFIQISDALANYPDVYFQARLNFIDV